LPAIAAFAKLERALRSGRLFVSAGTLAMPPHHRESPRRLCWAIARHSLAAASFVFSPAFVAPRSHALDANWLAPANGDWNVGSNWSTDPLAPTAAAADATIAAAGAPYVVQVTTPTTLDHVTINSPDATLEINSTTFTAIGGVDLAAGKLVLRGGTLKGTRVSGTGSLLVGNSSSVPTLDSVELAVGVDAGSLNLAGPNTLDNVTLSSRFGTITSGIGAGVRGTGRWQLGPDDLTTPSASFNFTLAGSRSFAIGPNVRLETGGVRATFSSPNGATLINEGVIAVHGPTERLTIARLRNMGVLHVAGGGQLIATIDDGVGRVEIGPGGYLSLSGDFYFSDVVAVGAGARLSVNDSGNPLSSPEPIDLRAGGQVFVSALSTVPRISSTGGEVIVNSGYTPNQLAQLPVTGDATVRMGLNGYVDMLNGTFDYSSLSHKFTPEGGSFRNGTLTGPAAPVALGLAGQTGGFSNVTLDVPGVIDQGQVNFSGGSTIARPLEVVGGKLLLADNWSNQAEIRVASGGTLQLNSLGTHFGSIDVTGGALAMAYPTTLAALLALPTGIPDVIEIASVLDLEEQLINLQSSPSRWRVGGELRHGVIVGEITGAPLTMQGNSRVLNDVELQTVRIEGAATLRDVTASGVHFAAASNLTVFGASTCVLTDCTIDGAMYLSGNAGDTTAVEFAGVTRLNGSLGGGHFGGRVRFGAGATLAGTGSIGNTDGRVQGVTVEIIDSQFTIPAGLALVSATPYDSTDKIVAPNTQLRIDGAVRAGFATNFNGNRTDSWTFDVAALETRGSVHVTRDGRIAMLGDQWRHSGAMMLDDGLVDAPQLIVDQGASVVGTGAIRVSNGLQVSGTVDVGAPISTLSVEGSVQSAPSARFKFDLGGTQPGAGYDQLLVTGAMSLGGELAATLASGFMPAKGDAFTLLTAELGLSSDFDAVILPALVPGLFWTQTYTGASFVLGVVSPDFNGDGDVDAEDLSIWSTAHSVSNSADADGDGDSDGADYLLWQRYYGSHATVPSGAAVPEPTCVALAAVVVLAAASRRGARI
jgi:hypothetical protein